MTKGADTGNRQGHESVKPSQEGEATGYKLCSEKKQREALRDEGEKWTGSEGRAVGHGSSIASVSSLLPLLMILMTSVAAASTPKPANLAGRNLLPQPQEAPPTPEMLAAARGMEQMLLDHLIQEMRKTVPESEFMPAGQAEKIFRGMLDSEYARMLSEAGGVGIAPLVLDQLRGKR